MIDFFGPNAHYTILKSEYGKDNFTDHSIYVAEYDEFVRIHTS
ncbi:MAG: hypothetical protein PV340_05815 [Wolbachia sp.]|nr:hypothetical protein [Wolbachia sp.]